jgi:hypothetical protein
MRIRHRASAGTTTNLPQSPGGGGGSPSAAASKQEHTHSLVSRAAGEQHTHTHRGARGGLLHHDTRHADAQLPRHVRRKLRIVPVWVCEVLVIVQPHLPCHMGAPERERQRERGREGGRERERESLVVDSHRRCNALAQHKHLARHVGAPAEVEVCKTVRLLSASTSLSVTASHASTLRAVRVVSLLRSSTHSPTSSTGSPSSSTSQ